MHIQCQHCHEGAIAARWSCGCGKAWIACPLCRPLGFSCKAKQRKRGSASLTSSGTAPHPPPNPKRRRTRPTIGSAVFRGRGNYRAIRKPISNKGKASAAFANSSLTTSGCNYLGPYAPPPVPARSSPPEFPSACELSLDFPRRALVALSHARIRLAAILKEPWRPPVGTAEPLKTKRPAGTSRPTGNSAQWMLPESHPV